MYLKKYISTNDSTVFLSQRAVDQSFLEKQGYKKTNSIKDVKEKNIAKNTECVFLSGSNPRSLNVAVFVARMKGDTPVNSTMSVGQARKLVEQLKIEASFCRIKVRKAQRLRFRYKSRDTYEGKQKQLIHWNISNSKLTFFSAASPDIIIFATYCSR